MVSYKSDFLQQAEERGFIFQGTDLQALDGILAKGPVTAYVGFDATADCLHVGSLVPIMFLRLFQKTGHKPLVLMGGGTTRVGDPSGKDMSRQLLSEEQIEKNVQSIVQIFNTYLTFGKGSIDAELINNKYWLENLNYIEFLCDYGRHFTINRMLTFESVKLRLDREQPLTFLEFNYMILQAFDFVKLAEDYNCLLQLGGSDQWGNIVNGVDLTRRVLNKEVFGLTAPLIMTSAGEKMGKTAAGAVWLRADRLSPYDFWQYWRNTADADVGRFLRLFTDLPISEILKLESLQGEEINEAKKILADEVTMILHGKEVAQEVRLTAEKLFEEKSGGDLSSLPSISVSKSALKGRLLVIDLLVESGLVASKGEARRLIRGGGARINDQIIQDEHYQVTLEEMSQDQEIKLSAGKKKHALIRVID